MYFLYSVLMGLAAVITAPYWLVQGLRHGKISRIWASAWAFLSPASPDACGSSRRHLDSRGFCGRSAGGCGAGQKVEGSLSAAAARDFHDDHHRTASGAKRMPFADAVIYFPFDWAFSVHKVMEAVKPAVIVVIETEIWPNFLRQAGCYKVLVISPAGAFPIVPSRAFRSGSGSLGSTSGRCWPRLFAASGFPCTQTESDAVRLRALGAPAERVKVSGNLQSTTSNCPRPRRFPPGWKRNARGRGAGR